MNKTSVSIADSSTYMTFFKGNEEAYGQYIPPNKQNKIGEKQKGKSWTESNKRINLDLYKQHLAGVQGLGIIPIDSNNNVRFCVIDIDVYPLNIQVYQHTINEYDLPFLIFKSKSGGAHLYLFFKEDIKAEKIVPIMKGWLTLFGLASSTEIFPKQKRLRKTGGGNWINLPYFGNSRRLINEDCQEVTLTEALKKIEEKALTLAELKTIYSTLDMHNAPPCLQSIFIMNNPSMYEMYLFNLAIYLKSCRPNDWQELLYKANERLEDGISQERIEKCVVQQHEKKTYSYRCSEAPLCDRCDKKTCETRKYGKGGDEISDFTFEDLTQVMSDPPHYKWIVNGEIMTFFSEQELRDQNKFADYSMRKLHKVPNRLKNSKWVNILNKAFSDVKTEKVDLKDDISPGAILAECVFEFLFERARAKTRMQVTQLGRVYENEDKELLYFKKSELVKFITITKNFKYFGATQLQAKLRTYGAYSGNLYINKSVNSVRTWIIPTDMAKKLGESVFGDEEIDFTDLVDKQEMF